MRFVYTYCSRESNVRESRKWKINAKQRKELCDTVLGHRVLGHTVLGHRDVANPSAMSMSDVMLLKILRAFFLFRAEAVVCVEKCATNADPNPDHPQHPIPSTLP